MSETPHKIFAQKDLLPLKHAYRLVDKTQKAPVRQLWAFVKTCVMAGWNELASEQRPGDTREPFGWLAFSAVCNSTKPMLSPPPTPCQMFCQLQFWVWFLMPGSSCCCWVNEVPTMVILLPLLSEKSLSKGITALWMRGECGCAVPVTGLRGGGKNEDVVYPSSSCSWFFPNLPVNHLLMLPRTLDWVMIAGGKQWKEHHRFCSSGVILSWVTGVSVALVQTEWLASFFTH